MDPVSPGRETAAGDAAAESLPPHHGVSKDGLGIGLPCAQRGFRVKAAGSPSLVAIRVARGSRHMMADNSQRNKPDLLGDVAAEFAALGFEELEEIGRGGFGVVYRCLQPSLERTVAVKVLSADLDEEALDRFLREQRAWAGCQVIRTSSTSCRSAPSPPGGHLS